MKRIVRKRKISAKKAKKNQLIREQVEKDFPPWTEKSGAKDAD